MSDDDRKTAPLASIDERYRAGKELRHRVSREALAEYAPPLERDPLATIVETEKGRIESLLPRRHKLMAASAYAFLRGAADVMARDLAAQQATGLTAQATGDCHLMNFGAFASPEGNVLFDVNDFDETLPDVDIVFDLRRLATSVAVAALGVGEEARSARRLAAATAKSYRRAMREFTTLAPIEVWSHRTLLKDVATQLRDRVLQQEVDAAIPDTHKHEDHADDFPKYERANGSWRFTEKSEKIFHLDKLDDPAARLDLADIFASIAQRDLSPSVAALLARYRYCDGVFKMVGVGSVGTFCAVGLFMTADGAQLFLQIKQANASALQRAGVGRWSGAQAERVVLGQRMIQSAPDSFLGASAEIHDGREFYMRHLKKRRLGSIAELLEEKALPDYAELCGRTLAHAHARSGDAAMIAGYLGKGEAFDDAMASFAMLYAAQTSADHTAFAARYSAG